MKVNHHKCVAPDCSEEIRYTLLMCRTHWFMVPSPLRRKVTDTYRDWRADMSSSSKALQYKEARDEAVLAVTP